jgi:RNA polymerase sigma-70 factor, ECF subfamily
MSQWSGSGEDPDVGAMGRLAMGDDLALNEIMDRWTPRLGAYLARFLGSQSDAADLVQETFVAVYRARFRYRPTAGFSSWIFGIASNLARQKLRWRKRHPEVALDLELHESGQKPQARTGRDPSIQLQAEETAVAVRSAVMSLPAELREALILGAYEELPQAEIAQILGCSTKAVETRIYRAKQLLRKKLQAERSSF